MGCPQRCPNPHECKCPLHEKEEVLKCGLCKTCDRRADTMDSTLIGSVGLLEGPGPRGGAPNIWQSSCVGADSVTDKVNGSRINSHLGGNPVQRKQWRKFGWTGHCRGADGKKGSNPSGSNLQSDKQLPGDEGLAGGNAASSRKKPWSLPYWILNLWRKQLGGPRCKPFDRVARES